MMDEFRIEKGVPLPGKGGAGGARKYPFPDMEVGDSFPIPQGLNERVGMAASQYGLRYHIKLSVRKTPDGSYRCWRIA